MAYSIWTSVLLTISDKRQVVQRELASYPSAFHECVRLTEQSTNGVDSGYSRSGDIDTYIAAIVGSRLACGSNVEHLVLRGTIMGLPKGQSTHPPTAAMERDRVGDTTCITITSKYLVGK